MAKIEFDVKKCIGCESCVSICPHNWKMQEGHAVLINEDSIDVLRNAEVVKYCPMGAIKLKRD